MSRATNRQSRVSPLDDYLFAKGVHGDVYQVLGAHPMQVCGKEGVYFAVWAPMAKAVEVIGTFATADAEENCQNSHRDFSQEEATRYSIKRMEKCRDTVSGIWEVFVEGALAGDCYQFRILTGDGRMLEKADPYAYRTKLRPKVNCSVVCDLSQYGWRDEAWLLDRKQQKGCCCHNAPMSVYEIHPGSWRRNEDGSFYTYAQLAKELTAYVKEMGYTHVELMGILEHPVDASWGYQVTGYYAPTARYGTPEEFRYLIDTLHQNGIGVILDWVPAHFANDSFGLSNFDGSPLYEYGNPMQGENKRWGTKCFDLGKPQVQSFLIGNALFWLKEYHLDGLRADAVAATLYLDYDREPGEWIPNRHGGNVNEEAVSFWKLLSETVKKEVPDAMLIAEESSAWPGVTGSTKEERGLGFDYKWNMGWMHDFLEYMETDSYFRKYHHHKMTFSLTYEDGENFVLPLSHDEVVHLKKPLFYKMFGQDDETRFAAMRTALAFMFGHPGKKLLFMGNELAVRSEWNEAVSLDWGLLSQMRHEQFRLYVRDLLWLYREFPVLWEYDNRTSFGCFDNFQWMDCEDAERSVFSFVRKHPEGKSGENLVFLLHFTPVDRFDYSVRVPKAGAYRLVFDEGGYYRERQSRFVVEAVRTEAGEYVIENTGLCGYGVKVWSFENEG